MWNCGYLFLLEKQNVEYPTSKGDGHDRKTQSAESEMVLARMGDDNEIESKSGSGNLEGASGDDNDLDRQPKRKRYHRHTPHQIQEMEAFFKECPHPDDKQRKEVSRELGLEPLQVKFWFQNKRTQMKTHRERQENGQLRAENERLRADNMRYREAIGSASCPTCGGSTALVEMSFDDQHLMIENARLREEIDRITGIAANHVGKPLLSYPPLLSPSVSRSSLDLGIGNFGVQPGIGGDIFGDGGELLNKPHILGAPLEIEKPMVIERAVSAMEELLRMAQLGEPLWVPGVGVGGPSEVLSEEEYLRCFPRGFGPRPFGFKSEASRETVVVMMNPSNLVEILMDVNQSSRMFFNIISRGATLEILSTGVGGNWNGALQVMSVEFQLPTPLVPTRESYFVRYCKRHHDGSWAVADVSLDNVPPGAQPVLRCRRRPSGCVIQEMPNGYSKVTWVEHVEVDDREVHSIYRSLVNSGLAFGAKRWVSTLGRQCERIVSAMAISITPRDAGVITSLEARQNMLKLAERIMISFCEGVSSSTAHTWTALSRSGGEEVRVITRKCVGDPGRPSGIVLSAATSFRLPVPPRRVFDFLRDENSRNEWDILSNGAIVQEMAHIANGHEPGNCVSLLRVDSPNSNQSNMLILQESCTDSSGSYVIYAPVDIVAMDSVLAGRDPDSVALLPSGFAILPDGPTNQDCGHVGTSSGGAGGGTGAGAGGGSLLTVGFQILVDSAPTANLSLASVATVNNLIVCTVDRIKASVTSENA